MARKTVLVSDLSGEEIPEGKYVHVAISDGSNRYDLDVIDDEVAELVAKGRKSKRRGRKGKSA
jgi:hypothetical protein